MKRFNTTISLNIALSAKTKAEAKEMSENFIKVIQAISLNSHPEHGAAIRAIIIRTEELKF